MKIPATNDCPAHQSIDEIESISLMDKIESKEQIELIKKYQLQPFVSFRHKNVNILLSKKFMRISSDRQHTLAYIEINGEVHPRIFYHSNSHGTFRVINGIIGENYNKYPGQNFISIPFKILKFLLNDCVEYAPRRSKKEMRELLELASDHLYYLNNNSELQSFLKAIDEGLQKPALPYLTNPEGEAIRDPKDVILKTGFEPDFSDLITNFETETKNAGKVDVYVYRSFNKLIDYMLMKDSENKVWVAEVNTFGQDLNKFGVATIQYDFGNLIFPRWEYTHNIPDNYYSSKPSSYSSNYGSSWNYLREIKLIKDWYKANNFELPEKEN